ncbi:NAD(P)/FAD-dependent oxidoreductase [Sphingosinicella rhizophila]|uniref:FAD-dependent oxidoreductase n=1 Tax=Sphingosinicella rhizophila TaxID=3050082 RepID=A0ABU3QAS3_9SPHN|nr:FAD-dependent oxidoreductase [Sphingosinicella sp. GR2756]MDT9600502.1 FAD-dependent oxidoreductase [Sphingosinicella sp. GR2756]
MTISNNSFDFIVIGGGIAGLSIASALAATHRVALVDQEDQPGFHATGRSAALFLPFYGDFTVRALTRLSKSFFDRPPEGFSATPLLSPRQVLLVASEAQKEMLEAFWSDPETRLHARRLSGEDARALVPILRPEYSADAVLDTTTSDIDVHALQEGFMRRLRAAEATLLFGAPVTALDRTGQGWRVTAGQAVLSGSVLVNAAGAWADEIAAMAGLSRLGLVPCRRTAILVPAPEGHRIGGWPLVGDVSETFYFKPDAGALMVSPSDESACQPYDAQAEEIDVAMAVHKFELATTAKIGRVTHRWAGLRSFFPDRLPTIGYDTSDTGFFWLAGQGGFGIQTAPAMGEWAASLARGDGTPSAFSDVGLTADAVSPVRLDGIPAHPVSSNLVPGMTKLVEEELA